MNYKGHLTKDMIDAFISDEHLEEHDKYYGYGRDTLYSELEAELVELEVL